MRSPGLARRGHSVSRNPGSLVLVVKLMEVLAKSVGHTWEGSGVPPSSVQSWVISVTVLGGLLEVPSWDSESIGIQLCE